MLIFPCKNKQIIVLVMSLACLITFPCSCDFGNNSESINYPSEWPTWIALPANAMSGKIPARIQAGNEHYSISESADSTNIIIGFSYFGTSETIEEYLLFQIQREFSGVEFKHSQSTNSSGDLVIDIYSDSPELPKIQIQSLDYTITNNMSESIIQLSIPNKR